MKTFYLINDGEVFDGGEGQLADCFGIDPYELADWCDENDFTFEEKVIDETDSRYDLYF